MPVPYNETAEGSEEQVAEAIAELPDDLLAFGDADEDGAAVKRDPEPAQASEEAEPEDEVEEPEPAEADAEGDEAESEPDAAPEDDMVDLGDGATVPLSELVQAYQSRNESAAQTERLQGAIAQRAQAEVDRILQPLMQERQQVTQLAQAIQQQLLKVPDEPDPSLLDPRNDAYDPDRYHREVAQRRQAQGQVQALQTAMAQQQQRLQAEAQYMQQNFARQEAAKLLDKWPEWQEPKVQDAFGRGLEELYGIDAETIGSIYDHRFYEIARDALEYRKLKAEGPAKADKGPKPKAAPKLIKGRAKADPKQGQRKQSKAARDRLRRTGKLADAAAVFEQML